MIQLLRDCKCNCICLAISYIHYAADKRQYWHANNNGRV